MDEAARGDHQDIIARIMLEMEDVIGLIQTPRTVRPLARTILPPAPQPEIKTEAAPDPS